MHLKSQKSIKYAKNLDLDSKTGPTILQCNTKTVSVQKYINFSAQKIETCERLREHQAHCYAK